MSCGLFSVFDPVAHTPWGVWGVKWFTTFPLVLFLIYQMSPLPIGGELLKKAVFVSLVNFLSSLATSAVYSSVIFVTTFTLLVGVNISGLVPFCYSVSAHPGWALPIGLGLFIPGVVLGVRSDLRGFLAHFLPSGSPKPLWVFLILVETVSVFVRPLTLTVRLVANVMSGHLFLEMVTILVAKISSVASIFGVTCLLGFEVMVSVVQSYVFMMLLVMYFSENKLKLQAKKKKNW